MGFTFKPDVSGAYRGNDEFEGNNSTKSESKQFIRSKQDNVLFPELQVKDLKSMLSPDCINYIDSDGIAYKTASACQEDYVEVKNLITGEVTTYKNKTEFRGRTKKIAQDSVLGTMNIKREAVGEEPYSEEDFEITKRARLKHENGATIDGVRFEDTLAVVKHYIDQWIEAIKIQTQVPKVHCVLGEGKCHRNALLLPEEYKSNRTGDRPLLLKEARQYILDTYPSEVAPEGYETDEIVDAYAFKHYMKWRKTNVVTGIKCSPDKDAMGTAGFLFQGTKAFTFDNPQVWLIESSDVSVGAIELKKSKVKATGLKNTAWLMVLSDTADHYGSRHTMPKEMQPEDKYGDVAFYKDFLPLTTPQEVMQKVVDKFYDFFPAGVQYKAHEGTEIDEDTLWWLQQCFACQYMTRSLDDKTKVTDLLDRFNVDYKHLIGNNKPKVRKLANIEVLTGQLELLSTTLFTLIADTKPVKSETKPLQIERLERTMNTLKDVVNSLDDFYEESV